jgi:hypothetical protein
MHPRVHQDLGDGIAQAVTIEDAKQSMDRGHRVVLARQVVGQSLRGVVVALLGLLGGGEARHAQAAPRNGSASWTANGCVAFASMKAPQGRRDLGVADAALNKLICELAGRVAGPALEQDAEFEAIIRDLLSGRYAYPVRIVAFNAIIGLAPGATESGPEVLQEDVYIRVETIQRHDRG